MLGRESYQDYNDTSGMMQTQISSLDNKKNQTGNNIFKLNTHVQDIIYNLTSRGETTHDLRTNLFKGYT